MQALHDSHHNTVVLNVETLAGLDVTKLPSDGGHQLSPTMLLQKIARPVAVPSPHIHIKEATRRGDRTIQWAQRGGRSRHRQQQHLAGLGRRHTSARFKRHPHTPKLGRVLIDRHFLNLPPQCAEKSLQLRWISRVHHNV